MTQETIKARRQILSNYINDIITCTQMSNQGKEMGIENDVFGVTTVEEKAADWLLKILNKYELKYRKMLRE